MSASPRADPRRVPGRGGRAALTAARVVLLAGPVALAFFSGGYFDAPREWAGLVTWALLAVAMLAGARAVPRRGEPRLALAGIVLLAAWTLASFTWAPVAGSAYHAGEIAILYAGTLLAAAALLQTERVRSAVEPAIAAGTLIVVGYAISERLLPGLLSFRHSVSAQGRLDQPLTYWNAMGEVAALGVVLAARLAGDDRRPARLRIAAAAAAAPLGLGLYLTFSRGALYACAAGIVALLVAAPSHRQLRSAAVALAAVVLTAAAAAPFSAVTALTGRIGAREGQGAIVLALLTLIAIGAAVAQRAVVRRTRPGTLRLPRHAALIAVVLIAGGFALALAVGAKESGRQPLSPGATRYTTLQSNRYAYWKVALHAFGDQPLRGVGAGGWAVYWQRRRPFDEGALDAHSLYFQTGAELGLVGLVLLGALLGGVAWSGRAAWRAHPAVAAGPIAGCVVWAAHVALDWDWQMPAATLGPAILAGVLLALADRRDVQPRPPADVLVTAPPRSAAPLA